MSIREHAQQAGTRYSPKTLAEHVRDGSFRACRHAALVPQEQPDDIEWSDWLRLLRRVGRRNEAKRLVVERVKQQVKPGNSWVIT